MTSPQTDGRSKVILAVDDSPQELSLLNMMLLGAGYTVVGAASGEACLDLVHRCSPRLILLDIAMPGMDGIETCRRLRTDPELRSIPIAFLTGSKTRSELRRGVEAGGNDFILKPVARGPLLERVRHWTSQRVGGGTAGP